MKNTLLTLKSDTLHLAVRLRKFADAQKALHAQPSKDTALYLKDLNEAADLVARAYNTIAGRP